jgi:hypothetical protein
MSPSTSTRDKRGAHHRGAHGSHEGGGSGGHDDGGGGGGGGGGGKLVKVAFGRTQAEAEMLQGLLSEAGIPSVLRRSAGFDSPQFSVAGPHDVMVNKDQAPRAREVLSETLIEDEAEEREEVADQVRAARAGSGETSPQQLALWLGIAFVVAVVLIWIVFEVS